jgi:hypothetical protein
MRLVEIDMESRPEQGEPAADYQEPPVFFKCLSGIHEMRRVDKMLANTPQEFLWGSDRIQDGQFVESAL